LAEIGLQVLLSHPVLFAVAHKDADLSRVNELQARLRWTSRSRLSRSFRLLLIFRGLPEDVGAGGRGERRVHLAALLGHLEDGIVDVGNVRVLDPAGFLFFDLWIAGSEFRPTPTLALVAVPAAAVLRLAFADRLLPAFGAGASGVAV